MWKPRPTRSEIISVDTERLAKHAFAQMGLVYILVMPHGDSTKLTVAEWSTSEQPNAYVLWFRSRRDAEKILNEVIDNDLTPPATRSDDGVVMVQAPIDQIDAIIVECFRWQPYIKPVTKAEIDARISSVKQEIDRALVRLQVTGAMSVLNQQYKQLRGRPRAEGEKAIPAYKVWATRQLEQQVLHLVTLTA